jgi:cytidylate kinase
MIVTIDGPAGAGKSSVARLLARRLRFCFLDTGAMYRAIALAAMRENMDWRDQEAVAQLAGRVSLSFQSDRVLLDGQDVTDEIRTPGVTGNTRHVANNPLARKQLVALQRRLAAGADVVTEGRDQGTVAFPHADCKFFLTASSRERALRRCRERQAKGETVSLEQVLEEQNRRDREDESRQVGRLVPADDAIVVVTDQLELDEVVDELERLLRQRLGDRLPE